MNITIISEAARAHVLQPAEDVSTLFIAVAVLTVLTAYVIYRFFETRTTREPRHSNTPAADHPAIARLRNLKRA